MRRKKDKKVFLEAKWQRLLSANYVIDPDILTPHIPEGTRLELYNDKCYVSLVAFRYADTKLMKVRVPFHQMFEEINLRFYVMREVTPNVWRSEVAFTKLFFPKRTLTMVAKRIYKENYETYNMMHQWEEDDQHFHTSYGLNKGKWHQFGVTSEKERQVILLDSPEYFFSKHYWGTSQINDRSSTIYEIEHPEWSTFKTVKTDISFDFGLVFGSEFHALSDTEPESVHLFDGSQVTVYKRSILC